MTLDPWSALQGPAASHAAPPPLLTYVDGDSVGFDLRLALPPVCLTCGGTDRLARVDRRLKVRADLDTALAMAVRGDTIAGAALRHGDRPVLSLPLCAACRRHQRDTLMLRFVQLFFPVWFFLVGVAAAFLAPGSIGVVFLGLLAALIGLSIWIAVRRASRHVDLESVDADGIVRLGGIHPDAAQAIVEAAARR
jgi:hypothetical protein